MRKDAKAIARWVATSAPAVIRIELGRPDADDQYIERIVQAVQTEIACGNSVLREAFPDLDVPGIEATPAARLERARRRVESLLNYGGFYVGKHGRIRLDIEQGEADQEIEQMETIAGAFKELATAMKNNGMIMEGA